MKKKFTLLLAAFMLLMVSAQAQSPLTFQWAHSVDGNTTAGDNVIGMAKSSDGNYYVATSFGSSSSQTNAMGVWIDGVESDEIEGSPYTGTSQNGESVIANPSSNMLKGFILQIDPFTGIVEKSAILLNGGISAFFGIYASSNSLYAYGYDFSKGAILVPINKDTYSLGDPITVCEYGTVGNAVTPIVDGESLIMANRGGKARATDNKAKFYGSSFSFSDMKYWGTVYYSFKINQ